MSKSQSDNQMATLIRRLCGKAYLHNNESAMPAEQKFTILYGSQTGQAKAIAEEIHERSAQTGLTASIFCLSLTDKRVKLIYVS